MIEEIVLSAVHLQGLPFLDEKPPAVFELLTAQVITSPLISEPSPLIK